MKKITGWELPDTPKVLFLNLWTDISEEASSTNSITQVGPMKKCLHLKPGKIECGTTLL